MAKSKRTRTSRARLISAMMAAASTLAPAAWAAPAQAQSGSEEARYFNIPGSSLHAALLAFADQAGVQLVINAADIRNMPAQPVIGKFSRREALKRLTARAAVSLRWTGPNTLAVRAAPMVRTALTQSQPRSEAAAPLPDQAPDTEGDEATETGPDIVVTGSSIRGAPAVGSNLISVGTEAIEDNAVQTVQELLQTVPQIWGSNASSQGAFGSFDASGLQVPQIHGLGGANSSSTLVVIDGHRFPPMGVRRNLPDPNFIPPNALQRVEVLAEGASSIYGSDAVAGVLNFITKRRFEGVELGAQYGFADDYKKWSATASFGQRWGDGGMAVFYSYSDRGDLLGADRPLTLPDQRARGGRNYGSFNCGPTSFQPTGSQQVYLYPYGGPGIQNLQDNAPCESASVTALMPDEKRHSLMVKLDHEVSDRLSLNGDLVYSDRVGNQRVSVGNITATVFGPGSGMGGQINPFFVAPEGTGAMRGTARFNGDELFPDGANVRSQIEVFYGHANAEYKISDSWRLTGFLVWGISTSTEKRSGELCGACVNLALNGSTNGNGNVNLPAIPGTNVFVSNLPLTADNALDIWNPAATNRTSAAVLARIRDSRTSQWARQEIQQYNLKLDGTVAALPAGDVRAALGGDLVKLRNKSEVIEANNTGPVSSGSSYNAFLYERTVKSVFGELLLPVVSEDMEIPGIHRLDLNISGRYDHYDEFGSLFNPKYAFNWEIIDGIKIRGNYAESFVAPQFSTYGPDRLTGLYGRSVDTFFGPQNAIVIPLDRYPEARAIPGCNAAGQVVCTLGSAGIAGMRLQGANPDVKPATGKAWALGADFRLPALPGFTASLTYWHNTMEDAAGGPQPSIVANSERFHDLIKIYPAGATAEEIEAFRRGIRQSAPLAAGPIYFSYDSRNQNLYTIYVEGIDFDAHYRHRFDWGTVSGGVAGTYKTKFDQRFGDGEPIFSVLNRNRFNSTFPTIRTEIRADLGVEAGRFKATAFANYTGGYTYWGSTATNPVELNDIGLPSGGGDKVGSYTTVSLNVKYDLSDLLPVDANVFVDIDNLFDAYPPFVNVSEGYDNLVGFVLGRAVTFGIRAKF